MRKRATGCGFHGRAAEATFSMTRYTAGYVYTISIHDFCFVRRQERFWVACRSHRRGVRGCCSLKHGTQQHLPSVGNACRQAGAQGQGAFSAKQCPVLRRVQTRCRCAAAPR
eukprot:364830-Chlamydomonas_euryale.AAC.7